MTFDSGKLRNRTMTGATPAQAAERLTAAGADVIGANCGMGVDSAAPIVAALAAATDSTDLDQGQRRHARARRA